MNRIGPLNGVPIACTIAASTGRAQLARWRAFDGDYGLGVERRDTEIVVRYVKTEDSVRRLHELVATESMCCSFVDWEVDVARADLRLIVSGDPEQLAAVGVGSG